MRLKAVAFDDELVPIWNKFKNNKKRLYISTVVYGGGHGTRRSQNRTNVENPRRRTRRPVCTRYCTHKNGKRTLASIEQPLSSIIYTYSFYYFLSFRSLPFHIFCKEIGSTYDYRSRHVNLFSYFSFN